MAGRTARGFLDRGHAYSGQHVRDVDLPRGGREHALAARSQQSGVAGRSYAERASVFPIEQRGAKAALSDVPQIAGYEPVGGQPVLGVVETGLVLGAALHPIEEYARQAATGAAAQILDVQ